MKRTLLSLLAAPFVLAGCGDDSPAVQVTLSEPTASVSAVAFGAAGINSATTQSVKVSNPNTVPLSISSSVSDATAGATFAVTGCADPIAPSSDCTLTVSFKPTTPNVQSSAVLTVTVTSASQGAAPRALLLPLSGIGTYAAPAKLLGFVPAAPGIQLVSIDPSNGIATPAYASDPTIASVNNLVTDAAAGVLYTLSSPGGVPIVNTLDAATGGLKGSVAIAAGHIVQAIQAGPSSGHLVGIESDQTHQGTLVSIDASTGSVTSSPSPTFNGFASFVSDPANSVAYVMSYDNQGNSTILTYDLATVTLKATTTLSRPLQGIQLGQGAGLLVAIGYNGATSQNEFVSIDLASGSATTLGSFNFSSNSWVQSTLVPERASNRLYAVTGDSQLTTFDLTTGVVLSTTPLTASFGVLSVQATPSGCPAGALYDQVQQRCVIS